MANFDWDKPEYRFDEHRDPLDLDAIERELENADTEYLIRLSPDQVRALVARVRQLEAAARLHLNQNTAHSWKELRRVAGRDVERTCRK